MRTAVAYPRSAIPNSPTASIPKVPLLLVALLLLPASDSGTDDPATGITTADVQGSWQKPGAVERLVISGSTLRGGDTSDLCFAETYTGTLSGGSNGTLRVASGPTTGSVSPRNGNLVVSGVTDDLSFDYNGTYSRAADSLSDC